MDDGCLVLDAWYWLLENGYWMLDAPLSAGFPLRYNWLWIIDLGTIIQPDLGNTLQRHHRNVCGQAVSLLAGVNHPKMLEAKILCNYLHGFGQTRSIGILEMSNSNFDFSC